MKKTIIKNPVRVNDIDFEGLYEEISRDWMSRGKRLQNRRWNVILQEKQPHKKTAKHVLGTKLWLIRI